MKGANLILLYLFCDECLFWSRTGIHSTTAMSTLLLQFLWFCLLGFVLGIVTNTQTCEKLDPKVFSSCVSIGHDQTFKLPSYVDKKKLANILTLLRRYRINCTASMDGILAVDCAMFVPLCKEGRSTPFLPCRRVCAEMVHGCYYKKKSIRAEAGKDMLSSWCNVLPNLTAASGKCFEPKNFKPTVNQSALHSMGKCHKRLIPTCGDQGHTHTLLSNNSQANRFKLLFNKTYASLNASDYALPRKIEKKLTKYSPKCASILRKFYCLFFVPPCFPEKPKKHFGVCKSFCREAVKQCPDIFRKHPEDLELCADHPEGETYKGLCAYTRWPASTPFWFVTRKKAEPTKPSKIKPGVIVAAVIVPVVVLAALAVGAVFLVRRYSIMRMAYRKQRDDVVSIVES